MISFFATLRVSYFDYLGDMTTEIIVLEVTPEEADQIFSLVEACGFPRSNDGLKAMLLDGTEGDFGSERMGEDDASVDHGPMHGAAETVREILSDPKRLATILENINGIRSAFKRK